MKAVFTSKIGSGYDDEVELRYHFPRTYLRAVEATVGDLIVYYEPRRGSGDLAYFGTAQVVRVRPDPNRADHFYADLSDYIDFDQKVPFASGGLFFESALRKADGSVNRGAFGRAVRPVPDDEFAAIVAAGFTAGISWPEAAPQAGLARPEFSDTDQTEYEGSRPQVIFSRPVRDRHFTLQVQRAYDRTCAVTGLRLINGGGRPEVQAAHIRPVSDRGPDSVRNGIALSGTMHWLFDRGLMTFDDDYTIRIAGGLVPPEITSLVNRSGRLILPGLDHQRPGVSFLKYHRDNVFKG